MEQKDPTPLQDETIIEEKNIEKQEEAPASSNDKKTNKVKKPVTRKRTMITSIIISVISCLVGGFGGYVLYSGLNPEEDPIVIEKGNTSYDVQAIEASLEEGTFISLYQEKLQDPLNYMLDQFVSQTPYTLVIGKGVVHAVWSSRFFLPITALRRDSMLRRSPIPLWFILQIAITMMF